MTESINMTLVKVGAHTFKVRPEDLQKYLKLTGGEVVGGAEMKAETKNEPDPVVAGLMAEIPDLSRQAAEALVASGYDSVEKLGEVRDVQLTEIRGVAAGSVRAIRKVVPQPGDPDPDASDDSSDE